jgi:4-hydroxybenzoate polyprenyltransferase
MNNGTTGTGRFELATYLELARLSNAPTVISNVLVGAAIGTRGGVAPPARVIAVCAASALLLYVGGMVLNDVCDAEIDGASRPERPIPSGRIRASRAGALAVSCLLLGVAGLALLGTASALLGALLAAAIVAYDLTHHRWRAAALIMGGCRGLVYLVAAVAAGAAIGRTAGASVEIHGGLLAAALALYVVVITIVARSETDDAMPPDRSSAFAPPVIALAPAIAIRPLAAAWAIVAGIPLVIHLAWAASRLLRRRPDVKGAVLAWLAGISLVDAFFLTLLERPTWAIVAAACFAVTVAAHRRIPGT